MDSFLSSRVEDEDGDCGTAGCCVGSVSSIKIPSHSVSEFAVQVLRYTKSLIIIDPPCLAWCITRWLEPSYAAATKGFHGSETSESRCSHRKPCTWYSRYYTRQIQRGY